MHKDDKIRFIPGCCLFFVLLKSEKLCFFTAGWTDKLKGFVVVRDKLTELSFIVKNFLKNFSHKILLFIILCNLVIFIFLHLFLFIDLHFESHYLCYFLQVSEADLDLLSFSQTPKEMRNELLRLCKVWTSSWLK